MATREGETEGRRTCARGPCPGVRSKGAPRVRGKEGKLGRVGGAPISSRSAPAGRVVSSRGCSPTLFYCHYFCPILDSSAFTFAWRRQSCFCFDVKASRTTEFSAGNDARPDPEEGAGGDAGGDAKGRRQGSRGADGGLPIIVSYSPFLYDI